MANHPDTRGGSVPAGPSDIDSIAHTEHADSHGTVFASDFTPPQVPHAATSPGHSPDSSAVTTAHSAHIFRSTSKLCAVCGLDCSKKPRVRNGDGRYACRTCFERTRLHRAAASVLTSKANEATGGTPAPEVCSAIHQTLSTQQDDDEDTTAPHAASAAMTIRPPTNHPSRPTPAPVQKSFFRRAIDAFLGRGAGVNSKATHR